MQGRGSLMAAASVPLGRRAHRRQGVEIRALPPAWVEKGISAVTAVLDRRCATRRSRAAPIVPYESSARLCHGWLFTCVKV